MRTMKTKIQIPGRWNENADRLVPRGKIEWYDGKIACAGAINGKPTVTIRKCGRGPHRTFVLGIPGWVFTVTEDMPVNRFNKIPGDKITETPKRGFTTLDKAKRAAQEILSP